MTPRSVIAATDTAVRGVPSSWASDGARGASGGPSAATRYKASTPPPNSRLHHIRRFYYDTAGAANPLVMPALKRLLGGTSHVVFGTDYPFGSAGGPLATAEGMRTVGFTPEELRGIDRDNAIRVFPRFR